MPIPKQAEDFLLGQGLDPAEYEIDPQTQDLVHVGGFTKQRLTEVLDFGKAAGRTLLGMPGAAVKALPILGSVAKRNLGNAADSAVRAALSLDADPTAGQRTAVDELGNVVPLPDMANKITAEELAANPLTRLGTTMKKAEEWIPPTSGVNKWAEAGGTIAGSIIPLVGEALVRKGYPSIAAGNLARSLAYLLPAGQQAEQVAERNIAHQQETAPSAPVDVEKAGARAAVAGLADLLLSKTVGGGSVVRAIEGAGAPVAKRALVQGGAGMVEGGTSAAIQDKLAEGKVNPENVIAGMVGGGIAQGGMAAAFGKGSAGKTPTTAEEAAKGFGADAAKPAEAEAPAAPEKLYEPGGPLPVTDEQMALLLDPTRPYKLLPKKYRGPFDELLADAHAEQLLRTPADIHRLVSAENPVAEFRKLHAERMSEQPPSFEQPPADETAVKAEAAAKASEKFQKDLEALEKQRKTLEKEIEVLEQHPALGAGDKVVGKWKARQTIETVDERIRKLFAEYNATRMATAADEPRVRTTEGLPVGKLESGMPPRPVQIGGNEVAITPTPARPARPDVSPALQRVLAEEAAAALQEAPLRAAKQQNLGAAQDVANTVRLADVMQRRKDAEAERQKAQWLAGEDLPGSRAYSGLPPEIFRPLRDLLNLEGENRVPFGRVQSGSVERPPMPERVESLQEQAKLVADPKSPKKAMLVTRAGKVRMTGPLEYVNTKHGPVIFNKDKTTEAEVLKAADGDVFDGRLLGYNETLPAGDTVVTTTVNNVPDVVTEVTTKDKVPEVIAGQQKLTGGKGDTTVTTPEEIAKIRGAMTERRATIEREFADSKVRDSDGNLMLVYHGTLRGGKAGIDVFDVNAGTDEPGLHVGTLAQASEFTHKAQPPLSKTSLDGVIYPVYVNIKNPVRSPDMYPLAGRNRQTVHDKIDEIVPHDARELFHNAEEGLLTAVELREGLQKLGYDGIVYQNTHEGGRFMYEFGSQGRFKRNLVEYDDSYVVFDPRQIKSANSGNPLNINDPRIAYSTLFGLTPEDFKNFRKMAKEPWNLIPRAIHAMTSGATDKMAARDPLLAAASERYKLMDRDSRRIIERKAAEADKYEKFIKDKDVIEWLNNSTDEQKHDVSKLPAKWRTLGQEWVDDYIKSFHREQIANKVNVQDSNGQWRKPVDRPGYFPWAMSADVNERLQTGSAAERQRLEDIWVRNWKHFVPKATTEDALTALAEQRAELARVQVNQGQPLFSAVIREYGVPLPKEFRATPAESLDRYIQRWGKHMAWAKYAQNDPLMRRAFGITADSQGNDTTALDSKHRMTNADWQDAFRAGQQVDAPWTWDATPAMYDTAAKEGRALSANDTVAQDILASYTGRSREAGGRLFNSIQRLTSPIVMGHASKLRDITQSLSTSAEYVPSVVQMAADVAKASADLRGAAREARAAGFLERDPFAHEGWNDVSTKYGPLNYMAAAVKKAAEGARDYLGMKHMDIASKILAFEPARAAVERELAVLGKEKSPLVKEFGPPPSQLKAMSDKDIIQLTANKIADVVTPRYSAENVPHKFLPQNKDALGMMFRLMTWSIARYNNWYKHNWLAATKQQRPMRLVKSLFYGTLGGAATATLLEFLRDKKPAKLTMTEWLGLDDDTKWRELAPLVGGYIDAQGSLGVLGWAANKGIMAGYGRPAASADLDPMLPALIAGRQLFETLASFAEHGMDKGWSKLDVHDLGRLSLELASIPQTGRDIVSRLGLDDRKESRDVNREVKVFEQVTGRSAKTGAPMKPPGFFFDKYRRNPFSLAKEVNEAKTLDDLLRLAPQLREERARGYELPAIQGDEKVPAFYQDVARRRGLGFARQVAERDVEEAKRDAAKRALLGR